MSEIAKEELGADRLSIKRSIERNATGSAFLLGIALAVAILVGAFLFIPTLQSNNTEMVAVAGLAVLATFGGFRVSRPMFLKWKVADATCKDCGATFSLVKKVNDELISSSPRVQRVGFRQSGDNGGGWKDMIRETTWVDEIHRITTELDCVSCKKHTSSTKTVTRSTGKHTTEFRA